MLLGLILPIALLLLAVLLDMGLVAWVVYQLGHDRVAARLASLHLPFHLPSLHVPHWHPPRRGA